jgi:DNA-directed RNA polymerase specialized sigma24 family protein
MRPAEMQALVHRAACQAAGLPLTYDPLVAATGLRGELYDVGLSDAGHATAVYLSRYPGGTQIAAYVGVSAHRAVLRERIRRTREETVKSLTSEGAVEVIVMTAEGSKKVARTPKLLRTEIDEWGILSRIDGSRGHQDEVHVLLDFCTPQERHAVVARFGLSEARKLSLAETAHQLGISVRRVSQLIEQALRRMRSLAAAPPHCADADTGDAASAA